MTVMTCHIFQKDHVVSPYQGSLGSNQPDLLILFSSYSDLLLLSIVKFCARISYTI